MNENELKWEQGCTYIEADITDHIGDDIFNAVCNITVTIRKYKTVYTIAAIIDYDGNPGYMPDDSDFYVPFNTDSFVKIGSYPIKDLAVSYDWVQMIKDINHRLRSIVKYK